MAEAIGRLSQTYANREVIVIDDSSTGSDASWNPSSTLVRVVRKTNGGTASALNVGLKVADGDYVAWLSSDDIFRPQKIARQVEFLRQQRALACYSAFSHIDSSGAVVQQGYRPTPLPTWRYLRRMTVVNPVNGCTVLIRREVFEQVGPFDESLRYTHDYEMWMRIIWKFDMHYLANLVMYRLLSKWARGAYRLMQGGRCSSVAGAPGDARPATEPDGPLGPRPATCADPNMQAMIRTRRQAGLRGADVTSCPTWCGRSLLRTGAAEPLLRPCRMPAFRRHPAPLAFGWPAAAAGRPIPAATGGRRDRPG